MKKINRQGFTLIEIITTVIILGVIMTVAVIAVNRYIERAKDSTYNSYVNNIEVAAENHMIDCVSGKSDCDIPESGYSKKIPLDSLIEAGYSEKLKDPNKEGAFCSGYVLVENQGASIPDLKYKGCLKCSNYETTEGCNFEEDNDDDNKILACENLNAIGESTEWTRNSRTIKFGCNAEGKDCKYKKTFEGTNTNPVIKQGEITIANGDVCPVNVYIDTTKPECDLIIGEANVGESGWYLEDVEVSLYPSTTSERGLGDFEFGISTSTKKDYNSKDKITVTKGITTVFGYVKDELGNEGYCAQEIKVDTDKPEQSPILGYQVYPENKNETTKDTNEQILQINDLEKYRSVKGILVFLKDSTTGNIQLNYSVDSANTSGNSGTGESSNTSSITSSYKDDMSISFENKQMIEFILPVFRTINSLDISGINPEIIDKVVMLVENPNGLYTNKDMLVYNFAKDETTGVGDEYSYSFDGGNTWQTNKYKWYSSNGTVVTKVKDSIGSSSEEHSITINQIDKTVPVISVDGYRCTNNSSASNCRNSKVGKITVESNSTNFTETLDLSTWSINGSVFDYSVSDANFEKVSWSKNTEGCYSGCEDVSFYRNYTDKITNGITLRGSGLRRGILTAVDKAGNSVSVNLVVHISNDFKITLDQQGGNGTSEIYERYGVGYYDISKSKISSINKPSKTGYTFEGYYTKSNGEGEQMADSNGKIIVSNTKFTSNTTWYAHWAANNYTVSFNANGGSVSTASQKVTYNSTYGTLPKPTRTGYTFSGWYTAQSGGTKITSSSTVTITSDRTLYAHWTAKTITVTFHKNDNTETKASQSFTYGVSGNRFGYKTDGTPRWEQTGQFGQWNRTGYKLLGWSKTSDATKKTYSIYSEVSNDWIDSNCPDIDLYAVWQANTLTVHYNANGGSINSTDYYLESDSIYDKTKSEEYSQEWTYNNTNKNGLNNAKTFGLYRDGYSFAGWRTTPSDGELFEEDDSTVIPTKLNSAIESGNNEVTMYAQWLAGTCSSIGEWSNQEGKVQIRGQGTGFKYTYYKKDVDSNFLSTTTNPFTATFQHYKLLYYVANSNKKGIGSNWCYTKYDNLKPYTTHIGEFISTSDNVVDFTEDCTTLPDDATSNLNCTVQVIKKDKSKGGSFKFTHSRKDQPSNSQSGASGINRYELELQKSDNTICVDTYYLNEEKKPSCNNLETKRYKFTSYDNAGNVSSVLTMNVKWV